MNSLQKIKSLRERAIHSGFDLFVDRQFYIAERRRVKSDKPYVAANTHHALFFDPCWVYHLLGDEPTETGLVDKDTLEPIVLPRFVWEIMKMARMRAENKDIVDYLYKTVTKERDDQKTQPVKGDTIVADEENPTNTANTRV
jgi:hypothetical protein